MAGATGDVIQAAKAKVQVPAILLILNGIIALCGIAYGIAQGAGQGDFDTEWDKAVKKIEDDPSKKDEEKKAAIDFMNKLKDPKKAVTNFAIVLQVAAAAIAVLCIVGGIRVMSLKNRGLGLFASIVSFLPLYFCCCLGILIGIWMIIALSNPVVKRGFEIAGGSPVGSPVDDLDTRTDR